MEHHSLKHPNGEACGEERWKHQVYALWDELANFGASSGYAARLHLLRVLSTIIQGKDAEWVGFVRQGAPPADDPMQGWRPQFIQHYPQDPLTCDRIQQAIREMEIGEPDLTAISAARGVGKFRVESLEELANEDWFHSRGYREFYRDVGRAASLWASIPVNDNTEVHIGLHRSVDQPPFGRRERAITEFCLRGLRWFYLQQALNEGLGITTTPLTRAESKVLQGLLDGLSEKAIAEVTAQSQHTVHSHVKRIFRKYDVNGRPALMALWIQGA